MSNNIYNILNNFNKVAAQDAPKPAATVNKTKTKLQESVEQTLARKLANEGKKAKPDYIDADKDGDKKEPMKKAFADKKRRSKKQPNQTSWTWIKTVTRKSR